MKALIIEVKNWSTGERADDIEIDDIKDGRLKTLHPMHQQLDSMPRGDYEIRMINDDRNISDYDGEIILESEEKLSDLSELSRDDKVIDVNGVVPVESIEEINNFIVAAIDYRYLTDPDISEEDVYSWVRENGLMPDEPYDRKNIYKIAIEEGITGVRRIQPPKIKEE